MEQTKKLSRKVISILLSLLMVFSCFSGMSLTAWAVEATTLTAETTTWENGDYVVPTGGVTISGHITVNGTVNLTLTEGATLTANTGITLSDGATLNVSGKGTMAVNGSNNNTSSTVAGTGMLVLNSGTLTAKGGTGQSFGNVQDNKTGAAGGVAINGAVTVAGGTLNATGGNGGSIGKASDNSKGGAGGVAINGALSINCGSMTASKGNNGSVGAACRNSVGGVGGDGYDGTLTLGSGVKLYEGTEANEEKLLDGNDSTERSYSGSRPQNMFAEFISTGSVDEITWEGSILKSLTDSNGITVTGDGIAYAAAGLMFQQHSGPINFSASNGYFTKIVITCNELENRSGATISGFTQSGNTLTWTGESANVTIPQNSRGLSLYGVTSIKFTGVGLIPTVDKSALETAITAAETLYDSIKDDTDYSTIASTLKTAIDAAKEVADSETADQNAVDTANGAISDATTTAVVGMINALPASTEVTTSDKDKIEAVRAAYDNLTDAQKESFDTDTLKKLTDAETALQDAIDTETAQGATNTINALPDADKVTTANKDAIEAARKAYNDLTDDQKKKVSDDTLKKLTDAEDALKAAGVSDTINALPAADEVTTADKDAIEKARKAYDALTDEQKAYVPAETLKKLTDAESALAVAEVNAAIDALPAADEVTTANKDAIEAARKAYDALTDDEKAKIAPETLKKLTDAESALAVATANEAINALPAADEVTTANKDAIEAARKAYDALTDEEKEKIAPETLKKLTDAESAFSVASVKEKINALPAADEVTTANKDAIEAARGFYDALTDEEKAKVAPETLKKLTDAEDALAAATVSDEIKALPAAAEITTDNKAAIAAARKVYDALTDEQKAYVAPETLKKLTDAESALAVAEANKAISELPEADKVTLADKDAVEAARKAYDALTDEEKAKIPPETLEKLTNAEKAYAAEKEADDTAKAKDASDKIAALPKAADVTTKDEKAIKAARAAYDALSDEQKAKVPADTLKQLEESEKALAQAKAVAAAKKDAKTAMNNQITVTQKGKKITVKWKKAAKADGYFVYVQYCSKKFKKPAKTIKKNSTTKVTITKLNGKKINLKKNFKVIVKPYKIVNGKKVVLATSISGHIVGVKNKKYTNVKTIKATKKALTVKVGKTKKAKAKVTLVDKKKKHIPSSHAPKFRYRTSNKSIATVDKNGKIKGIKKGTCTIYVYAINGKMTKIKVTVK
ncbi:MAG: Ig-like domain-containing protein [Eubacterium sp.]|nr:Ig-like domain-containing protein [Eubacterium sp.]